MSKLILASKSPRRRELLGNQKIDFEILVPDVDEKSVNADTPSSLVCSIAELKAKTVESLVGDGKPIVSADTVVSIDGKVLGKPKTKEEAYEMLSLLSGRTHTVYTGYCVIYRGKTVTKYVASDVIFADLSEESIEIYVESGEPMDKAGAYGVQGEGARLVREIHGDFYTVMGLPVCDLIRTLEDDFGLTLGELRK